MKYIKAILYTTLMTVLFLTGIVIVEGIVGADQIDKLVEDAINTGEYDKILSGNYQKQQPFLDEVAVYEDVTMTIKGFETMSIIDDNPEYYVEFLVIVTEGFIPSNSDVGFELIDGEFPIKFLKILNREVYLIINDDNQMKLDPDAIFSSTTTIIDKLVITYGVEEEAIVYEIPINVARSDLSFKNEVDQYLAENDDKYPTQNTTNIIVATPIMLNTSKAVLITVIVEAILIAGLTVYIYVIRPKRKLGKIKPSKHLAKDLERIEQSKENKK